MSALFEVDDLTEAYVRAAQQINAMLDDGRPFTERDASSVVGVIAPLVEAQVRAKVAAEIEAGIPLVERRRDVRLASDGIASVHDAAILTLQQAARIARGES